MKIITSIFGSNSNYVALLEVMLFSCRRHNPDAEIIVYHSALGQSVREQIGKTICGIHFMENVFDGNSEYEMASQKMSQWNSIIHDPMNDNADIVLMDCDTLVLGDLSRVFQAHVFDFAHTPKDFTAPFPLNTGVVFLRNGPHLRDFVRQWHERTFAILRDESMRISALNTFGSADQQALAECLRTQDYFKPGKWGGMDIVGLPASIYNLHHYWNLVSDRTQVIHFKSGWINLLLHEGSFADAIRTFNWTWPGVETWEPSWELWRSYRLMYETACYLP